MFNKVIQVGRLTQAPELHRSIADKPYIRGTLAVNRRYKDKNGEREADFLPFVIWGKPAELMQSYAGKGSLLLMEGELRARRYEKDGEYRTAVEVLCQHFQLLETRAQRESRVEEKNPDLASLLIAEDDLPF